MNPTVLTADDAFVPQPDDTRVPFDKTGHDFRFTRRWFELRNMTTWSSKLIPTLRGVRMEWPVKVLQLGVFEGADLAYLMQKALTHADSRAVAVDPWLATTKLDQTYMNQVEERARHNLSPWQEKITIIKGFSQDVLAELCEHPDNLNSFDLIVIDGDHNRSAVLQDALYSYQLAKPGGHLVFDDVRNRVYKSDHVVHGIDDFLATHKNKVKLEWRHRYCDCYSKL